MLMHLFRACAENGPFFINDDGDVEERRYAWDVTNNIIFVDSPINVGYSYSDDPRDRVYNESVLAADLLDFLEEFLDGAAFLRRFDLCFRWGQVSEVAVLSSACSFGIVLLQLKLPWIAFGLGDMGWLRLGLVSL
jgi:hypothetical protein